MPSALACGRRTSSDVRTGQRIDAMIGMADSRLKQLLDDRNTHSRSGRLRPDRNSAENIEPAQR
eukprot:1660345-Rhodomonas_salina.4